MKSLLGPLGIDGPIAHRLANLTIALRYFRNTKLYVRSTGQAPDYANPTHFTEKMQCRKLFDRNPLFTVLCDKLEARAFVENAGCDLKLPEIYWQGTDPAEIPFDRLPVPYMVKANHRSGALHAVRDRRDENRSDIRSRCRRWLSRRYGRSTGEWGYRDVPRRIYAEELLPAPGGQLFPDDYKFVTFSGRVAWIEHIHDRGQGHFKTYFDRDWNRIKVRRWVGSPRTSRACQEDAPRPAMLERMIEISEHLARGIDQLRVDLYEIDGDIYFGEFTVYEESGLGVAYPEDETFTDFPSRDLDREIGEKWCLAPVPLSAKLSLALFGRAPGTGPD